MPRRRIAFRCAVCGPSTGRLIRSRRPWSLVRCDRCNLVATWPTPDPEVLARAYETSAYYRSRSDPSPAAWMQRAREIVRRLPRAPRAILDFGAGEGHLVASFRALGIDADGIEPSKAGRGVALRAHGLVLAPELSAPATARFDAVTLLHSLEHVPDPVATLTQLGSMLAPGGAVFIEVPNFGSVDMALRRERDAILDLPVHLHHFTPRTLEHVAEAAGLSRTEVVLFNATAVEWALSRRAARRAGGQAGDAGSVSAGAAGGEQPGSGLPRSQTSRARLLAATRRLLPGPKFQWIGRR